MLFILYAPNFTNNIMTVALAYSGRDETGNISQTTFSNVFSSMKIFEFRLTFHWRFLLWVQSTIFYLSWPGAVQTTSHYLYIMWQYIIILRIDTLNTSYEAGLGECHRTLLKISQHWFRYWLGAVRQQTTTCANVDHYLCSQMESIGRHNALILATIVRFYPSIHESRPNQIPILAISSSVSLSGELLWGVYLIAHLDSSGSRTYRNGT